METFYDFPTAVRLVGPVRRGKTREETTRLSYHAIRYAVRYQRIVEPRQYGKALLFTPEQIRQLKRHFAEQQERKDKEHE